MQIINDLKNLMYEEAYNASNTKFAVVEETEPNVYEHRMNFSICRDFLGDFIMANQQKETATIFKLETCFVDPEKMALTISPEKPRKLDNFYRVFDVPIEAHYYDDDTKILVKYPTIFNYNPVWIWTLSFALKLSLDTKYEVETYEQLIKRNKHKEGEKLSPLGHKYLQLIMNNYKKLPKLKHVVEKTKFSDDPEVYHNLAGLVSMTRPLKTTTKEWLEEFVKSEETPPTDNPVISPVKYVSANGVRIAC